MGLFDNKKTTIKITVDTDLYNAYMYHTKGCETSLEQRVVEMMRSVVDSKAKVNTSRMPTLKYKGSRDDEYRSYLINVGGKTSGTAYSYRSAVNCFCKIANQNFWDADVQTVENEYKKWKNMPEFINAPLEQSKTLSNGIKRYIEFLYWKGANI